ncbi:MAG: hypothetical protein R6U96_02740 [Promethearchaeia archaeon]
MLYIENWEEQYLEVKYREGGKRKYLVDWVNDTEEDIEWRPMTNGMFIFICGIGKCLSLILSQVLANV